MTNASIAPGWAKRPSMIWLVLAALASALSTAGSLLAVAMMFLGPAGIVGFFAYVLGVLGVHGWTVVELVRVPGRNAVARTIVILTLVGCGLFLANILILALWLLGAIR